MKTAIANRIPLCTWGLGRLMVGTVQLRTIPEDQ